MIGQTIAHYRVTAKLGAGGMGEVYRATDTKLGRDVALKLLPPESARDDDARAQLIQEARNASALNHPNICHIYEVNEAGGVTYFAMELIEGAPLSKHIPPDGLPAETVIRFGQQIAAALAHAHERGVLHRDLKSSNVMITREGAVKVLDFGLAQRLRSEELGELTRSKITVQQAGAVAGTLPYLAPEVLSGQPTSERSDIWALGVLLQEMASGAMPFEGRTGFELTSAILKEPPRALEHSPPTLRGVIQHCLAKEPGQRYPRAGEVRAALEAIQSDAGIAPKAAAPARSRRLALWSLVATLLLIAGALVVAVIRGVPFSIGFTVVKESPGPAGPRLSTGGKASARAEANEYFEKSELFMGTGQSDLAQAQKMLERALEIDPHFAEARATLGFTFFLLVDEGISNEVSLHYKAEEEIRRALQDDPDCIIAHSALAGIYLTQGRKELAPAEIEKALKINPDDLSANHWLMHYHWLNGELTAAVAEGRKNLKRNPLFWPARIMLGELLRQQGNTAGALREQEKVLEQDKQNVYALRFLARTHMDRGDLGRARQTLERARSSDRTNYRLRTAWATQYALEGKLGQARNEMSTDVLKFGQISAPDIVDIAEFFALVREGDAALDWLDRAVRNGDERAEWFQRDPLLANIRNHPRFKQILDSIAFRRQQRRAVPPAKQ